MSFATKDIKIKKSAKAGGGAGYGSRWTNVQKIKIRFVTIDT
jgi:hypothetical protein